MDRIEQGNGIAKISAACVAGEKLLINAQKLLDLSFVIIWLIILSLFLALKQTLSFEACKECDLM